MTSIRMSHQFCTAVCELVRRGANMKWGFAVLALMLEATAAFGQTPSEHIEYYAVDAIGSVRVVFAIDGTVIGRGDFTPFGEELPNASLPPERFTGQSRDPEAGLDYFNARYYPTRLGRFSTVDPLATGAMENPQRWNRYAYALNNPVIVIDPDGQQPMFCVQAGSGVSQEGFKADSELECITGVQAWGGSTISLGLGFFDGWLSGGFGAWPGSHGGGPTGTPAPGSTDADPPPPHPPPPTPPRPPTPPSPGGCDKDETFIRGVGCTPPLQIAGVPRLSPAAAAALIAQVMATAGKNPTLQNELQEVADQTYPHLTELRQLHHIIPQYLGGPASKAADFVIRLTGSYHQAITNAFRAAAPYGQTGNLTMEEVKTIMINVYTNIPLP